MNTRIATNGQPMNPETVEPLQELIYALKDSVDYHREAAELIDDVYIRREFQEIAAERKEIYQRVGGLIMLTDSAPVIEGTLFGTMRKIWTSFRAALNSGDTNVVLIEAERAEDAIKRKFEQTLTQVAGNSIKDLLLKHYETVEAGHNRVLGLRNVYLPA